MRARTWCASRDVASTCASPRCTGGSGAGTAGQDEGKVGVGALCAAGLNFVKWGEGTTEEAPWEQHQPRGHQLPGRQRCPASQLAHDLPQLSVDTRKVRAVAGAPPGTAAHGPALPVLPCRCQPGVAAARNWTPKLLPGRRQGGRGAGHGGREDGSWGRGEGEPGADGGKGAGPGMSAMRCVHGAAWLLGGMSTVSMELGVPAAVYSVLRIPGCARCPVILGVGMVPDVPVVPVIGAGSPRARCYVVSHWNVVWAGDTRCSLQCVLGVPVVSRCPGNLLRRGA